ncbi:ALQxL family class IV lanthipeptide [Kitasatospora sp. NPDC008050]
MEINLDALQALPADEGTTELAPCTWTCSNGITCTATCTLTE